jgi:hypothetical protein
MTSKAHGAVARFVIAGGAPALAVDDAAAALRQANTVRGVRRFGGFALTDDPSAPRTLTLDALFGLSSSDAVDDETWAKATAPLNVAAERFDICAEAVRFVGDESEPLSRSPGIVTVVVTPPHLPTPRVQTKASFVGGTTAGTGTRRNRVDSTDWGGRFRRSRTRVKWLDAFGRPWTSSRAPSRSSSSSSQGPSADCASSS